jgi:RNA polymerase sigma-70 factor (ECF subfamily)
MAQQGEPGTPLTDELDAALRDVRQGGQDGASRLFRALHPSLLRYLRHQVQGVAEDLAAETWLAAVRTLPTFEGDARDFRALLFAVARRRVVDHYRRMGRRPIVVPLEAAGDAASRDDPSETVEAALSSEKAITALTSALPADQAEVIVLRVVADLSVEEVARIMERSAGAVRVLQHRALRRLRTTVAEAVTK